MSWSRSVVWRVSLAIVLIAASVVVAVLWDPTECVSPAYGCQPAALAAGTCRYVTYCTQEYVPLRIGIGIAGVGVGLLLLWSARQERLRAEHVA